jgi:uncharacterized membrane protein YdjX (TVP38/TMEM64 family)
MVVLALVVAWRLGLFTLTRHGALVNAVARLRHLPLLIPLFILGVGLAIVLGCPVTLLALLGGALFGLWYGLILNWAGAMLGAIGGYELASRLNRNARALLLGRFTKRIERLGAVNGFMSVFRLRLIPIVPFALVSIAGAFAEVPRRDYLIASALGSIPSIVAYTFCGESVLAGVEGAGHQALVRVAIAGCLLLVLSFAPLLVQSYRSKPGRGGHVAS